MIGYDAYPYPDTAGEESLPRRPADQPDLARHLVVYHRAWWSHYVIVGVLGVVLAVLLSLRRRPSVIATGLFLGALSWTWLYIEGDFARPWGESPSFAPTVGPVLVFGAGIAAAVVVARHALRAGVTWPRVPLAIVAAAVVYGAGLVAAYGDMINDYVNEGSSRGWPIPFALFALLVMPARRAGWFAPAFLGGWCLTALAFLIVWDGYGGRTSADSQVTLLILLGARLVVAGGLAWLARRADRGVGQVAGGTSRATHST
jgi:hypothetical protein